MILATFEAKLASFLPGLKTKISIALGAAATFVAAIDPQLIAPIIPPVVQPYLPIVFFAAAYYAHRLSGKHE